MNYISEIRHHTLKSWERLSCSCCNNLFAQPDVIRIKWYPPYGKFRWNVCSDDCANELIIYCTKKTKKYDYL